MPYRNALIPKMCPLLNLSYWHMYLRRRAYTFRASRRSECIEAITRRKLVCRKTTSKITRYKSRVLLFTQTTTVE